jgi:hypothetical protein
MRWKLWTAALLYSLALAYVFYDLGERRNRIHCVTIMADLDQTGVHSTSAVVK